ncbi:polysaccharide biosynthesis C-terminal domain-containing protein [Corynebacterium gallinarum]|uniref:SDR family oxidoreductase n=1 Tax=Corynebacterium gallinarum TaxID=2762214 RepID=A0A8I0LG58_9CORY|nr:NAD-dependent epimerase/dehydratase family protein [Corynebacterium gallinarum]MBD8031023.1 SDR family oxidoreductase [Corynebacterium gallinarum]
MSLAHPEQKKIAITGANGFLGFHVRAAMQEYGGNAVCIPLGDSFSLTNAEKALEGATQLIHLAGVNRGTDQEVSDGNLLFAKQLSTALKTVENPPAEIVYANSIQAGNGSVYGLAKEQAGVFLEDVANGIESTFKNIELPNLFGEFGRPFYNSVVATFSHQIANGERPEVKQDKELTLLHAQDAADVLLGVVEVSEMGSHCELVTVTEIKRLLEEFKEFYSAGEFPDISTTFRRNLFNTYRSYVFPAQAPILITRHADDRGSFFEIVRSNGGTGQTSFSTTVPGVTRGDHFHRRKVERFTVLSGEAEISLRKIFTDEVFTYKVSGEAPLSIDMPTFYTHKIENIGGQTLYTAFWTNDIFDPTNPDTIVEAV